MTKFQVGDEVEITETSIAMEGAKVGGIASIIAIRDSSNKYVVTYEHNNGWKIRGYSDGSNLKRLSTKPTKNQRISALEKEVAELKKVVEDMQKPSTLTEDIWDFPPREIAEHPTSIREAVLDMAGKALDRQLRESVLPQSNNQKRAAIIEKAKRFVEGIMKKETYSFNKDAIAWGTYEVIPYFTSNVEKRTVILVLKGVRTKTIRHRVTVKCHPHDVFNEHIGKAIALGRALGLDVSEFEQAVQPDEFAEGQVVIYNSPWSGKNVRTITRIEDKHAWTEEGGFFHNYRVKEPDFKITNDTNAQYEEVK